ncbi:hypothetical protein Pmar_PMAR029241 [Perkinsus marinus ATCC 50983]|uniref:Uncharacterized protein n=1 Tax=Perkinsus marinus (strain ATCC 50983 / TXsc) TaxID=423536 RepID=C5KML9_PERM5|nr:hypothetical protein Pmar_PMAR029241 [Perkinsus marinus ATCC 50983]EER14177.1 hypothetical protein Pmar_PMAR029241 [Perkinsus marinus ATCC 50983]|eukprot:XP_002782382.1 hypothetical protein Pmar_PMAR029241 [Perkinsus marinus ATCC 50983]
MCKPLLVVIPLLFTTTLSLLTPKVVGSYRSKSGLFFGCYIGFNATHVYFVESPNGGSPMPDAMYHIWRYTPTPSGDIMLWDEANHEVWPEELRLSIGPTNRKVTLKTPEGSFDFLWMNYVPTLSRRRPQVREDPEVETSPKPWGSPEEMERGRRDFAMLRDKTTL